MSATTVPELIAPPGVEQMPLHAIDRHFARFLIELNGAPSAELEFAAQMVSAWREAGHVCVPLRSLGLSAVAGALRNSRVVGAPSQMLPLILDANDRLYLHRYWEYEHRLASILSERLRNKPSFDQPLLSRGLERFYGGDAQAHEQRLAAEIAVQNNFCIITGGPGTGKTRTILVIVALLAEQFAKRQIPFRVELAAPTGKAAARMKEALESTAEALQLDATTRATIPVDAKTVHRLLGPISSSPYFRHDRKRPLATDLVIVDEASMVDLALMTKLLDALPKEARLILLGDKDQLASVEAGYVLGDISQAASESDADAPLHGRVVGLRTNFRFRSDSGIHRLASAVNEGNVADAVDLLQRQRHSDIRATLLPAPGGLFEAIRNRVARPPGDAGHGDHPAVLTSGYAVYRQTADPVVALRRFGQFRILAALRRGPYGIENLNRVVEESLAAEGLIHPESGIFYSGRPVLVLRNDPQLKLYNGDVGLILPDSEADGALRAFFLDARGVLRRFLPARLPEHETAFAMTVHKAQGSEFDRVLLVLPAKESPVLTRELIYTGVTRAKGEVEIWYAEEPLRIGLARRIARSSGLRALLGGKESDAPFTMEGARGAGRPADPRSSERPTGRTPKAPAAQVATQTEFWP